MKGKWQIAPKKARETKDKIEHVGLIENKE